MDAKFASPSEGEVAVEMLPDDDPTDEVTVDDLAAQHDPSRTKTEDDFGPHVDVTGLPQTHPS